MMHDIDVIVVGGGPVGLAAAIEARLAGLTVTVIESREGPVDKACGEGLMPGAVPLLARLGVDAPGMPLRGVSYRSATAHADHLFQSGSGLGVRRTVLHGALAERAHSLGVGLIHGRVHGVEQDEAGVSVTVGEEDEVGLRGRWMLACDGLHSGVRRQLGLDRPLRRARRYGLRQHFAVEPWSDLIEVHWSGRVEAYVTPVGQRLVGVALLGPQRVNYADELAAIPELAERLRGAEPASTLRGAGPLRQRARQPSVGRVLLVGDSSGYVDAITGEGLRLGFEQAAAAVRCLVTERPQDYAAEWMRITRDFRRLTSSLVAVAGSPFRGSIVPLARSLPGVYGAAVERLAR